MCKPPRNTQFTTCFASFISPLTAPRPFPAPPHESHWNIPRSRAKCSLQAERLKRHPPKRNSVQQTSQHARNKHHLRQRKASVFPPNYTAPVAFQNAFVAPAESLPRRLRIASGSSAAWPRGHGGPILAARGRRAARRGERVGEGRTETHPGEDRLLQVAIGKAVRWRGSVTFRLPCQK